jgi:hypothetical protein
MKTLKIVNGDLVLDSLGRLDFVSDRDLLIQSLDLRLKTVKGELFYNNEYGRQHFKGKYSKEAVLSLLQDCLLDDERVLNVQIIEFDIKGSQLDIAVSINLKTDETLDVNFLI